MPGEAPASLALPSAAFRTTPGGIVWLDFGVGNTGQGNLRLVGEYVIHDAAGGELARAAAKMDTVFAGDSTLLAVPLPVALAAGRYDASLCLSDPPLGVHTCSAALPLEVATGVAPLASSGAAPPPAASIPTVAPDSSPIIAALGAGLFFGLAFGTCVWAVMRRRNPRRLDPTARRNGG